MRLFKLYLLLWVVFGLDASVVAAPKQKPAAVATVPAADSLAAAFGAMPSMWGVRLSPDGSKISFLTMDRDELPMLVIYDFTTGTIKPILSSVPNIADLQWCKWANADRLLCGYTGIVFNGYVLYGTTRLVAVNSNGSKMKVLMQRQLSENFAQFQDRVVDYLVEDPQHVLIQVPVNQSTGTARLNIYTGGLEDKTQQMENVRHYISDGRGTPRLYSYFNGEKIYWKYRLAGETKWRLLYSDHIGSDQGSYSPQGFGEDPNKLYVLKSYEGRQALWVVDLTAHEDAKPTETIVYANPEADVANVQTLGKYDRLVAATYATDSTHNEYFDKEIERIVLSVGALYPDQQVMVTDESWDRRFYIILVTSDRNSGIYLRYDRENRQISIINSLYPELKGRTLSPMKAVRFTARDGVKVTGYLTRPQGEKQTGLPLVVLPHGGPYARDVWGYDWLPQYLAAKGYAVLQVNYRGSAGYGEDWKGQGGYKAWRQALDDITDGVRGSIKAGISDPARICAVGWSYGGYAALMSGVEHAELYRCIVSVAGVTDLDIYKYEARKYLKGKAVREFVGNESEVVVQGSPLKRAAQLKAPVLLFHGDRDINVQIKHSIKLDEALTAAAVPHEFIRYKGAEHSLERTSWRVDLLTRLGAFLDLHTTAPEQVAGGR
nr:alpha/beta fold hydrolase [Govania unica]